jgi:hypothetical protein
VTGTDANGCTNTSTVSVAVNPLPTIGATGTTLICPGDATTLNGNGGNTYSWQPGNMTGASVSVSPSANTTYTVTGTDANGCSNTTVITVTIDTPPTTPAITIAGNVLTSSVTGTSYQWFLNGNPLVGETAQSHTATQAGNYTVEVYTAIGCGSGQSQLVVITGIDASAADQFLSLYPNPNDGHFRLAFNAGAPDNFVLEIYNALGQVVYFEALNHFSGAYNKDISLVAQQKGMYTIRLRSGAHTSVLKMIVY